MVLPVPAWPAAERLGRSSRKLVLPLPDLIGVDVKLLRQPGQLFSPFTAADATFALKPGYGPARSSRYNHAC